MIMITILIMIMIIEITEQTCNTNDTGGSRRMPHINDPLGTMCSKRFSIAAVPSQWPKIDTNSAGLISCAQQA